MTEKNQQLFGYCGLQNAVFMKRPEQDFLFVNDKILFGLTPFSFNE